MADRIEREINEILEKLDGLPGEAAPERRPISIAEHRDRRQDPPRSGPRFRLPLAGFSPTHALLGGAGTVIGGLILSNVWAPLIWAAFAGVAVFIAGFILALMKTQKVPATQSRKGVYWRDRYIEYEPQQGRPWSKIRRRFRR